MWQSTVNKYIYRIPAFDGGLNSKYTDTNMPPNQSPSLQNVMYDDYGAVYGWAKYTLEAPIYGTAAVSGGATAHTLSIDALGDYVTSAGTQYLAAGYNGSVWVKTISSGSFDTIKSSVSQYSLGTYGAWTQYGIETIENRMWVTNPSVTPHKWDGTYWTTVGVPQLVTSATYSGLNSQGQILITAGVSVYGSFTVTNGTATPLISGGIYQYWMSGVNSAGVEGDYFPITTAHTFDGGALPPGFSCCANALQINNTDWFRQSHGVNTVNIYRNTAGASAIPYLLTALTWYPGPTATVATWVITYPDQTPDSSLVIEPPTDNGRPPNLKHVIYYRGWTFGFGNPAFPYRLYYSALGDPEIWPTDNYLQIGEGDGDPISGIAVYANSICIHKNNGKSAGSIWILYMPDSLDVTDDSNWYLQKTSSAHGACAQKTICFYNNLMFFFNRFGAFAFNGQDLAISAADSQVGRFAVDSLSFEIEPDVKALPADYLQYAEAITQDNKVWLSVVTNASTKATAMYVYDYLQASDPARQKGAWTKITQPGIHALTEKDGALYGSYYKDAPFVLKLNDALYTSTDLTGGSGIALASGVDSYLVTKKYYGYEEHRDLTKVWRAVNILVDLSGNWNLEVYYSTDLDETAGNTENVDLLYDTTTWGTFGWGNAPWTGSTKDKEWRRIILKQVVGETLQLKFRVHGAVKTFKISEMTLEYNLRGKR